MLSSLLPGLRDLRSSLFSGALWMLFVWLIVAPRIPDTLSGPVGRVEELGREGGPTLVVPVLAVVAYLVGSVYEYASEALRSWVRRSRSRLGTTEKGRLAFLRRVGPLAKRVSVDRRTSDRLRIRASREVQAALADDVGSGEQSDRLVSWALTDLRSELNLPPDGPISESAYDLERQDIGRPSVLHGRVADALAERLRLELPTAEVRLLARHREWYDEVQRHRAEASFRTAPLVPASALSVLFALQTGSAWWMLGLPVAAVLFIDGLARDSDADELLAELIADGEIDSPTIDRLRLATRQR